MQVAKLRTWGVLLPAMTLPFLASLFYFVIWSDHSLARILYALTKLFTLIWPILAVGFITKAGMAKVEIRDRTHFRALPLGWGVGSGIVVLMAILMLTPIRGMLVGCAPNIRAKAQSLGFLNHYWLFGLFLSLIHSFLEEYYWRWFVYGHLRQVVRKSLAHALAGLAFSAHHIVVTTQYFPFGWGLILGGATGAGGMIFSCLYERQGTLSGAWICHVMVDLGILSIGHWLLFGSYF